MNIANQLFQINIVLTHDRFKSVLKKLVVAEEKLQERQGVLISAWAIICHAQGPITIEFFNSVPQD